MKVSDYIVRFLHKQGVEVVFELIGGMITHLIDSLHREGKIKIVSMHHEQAAGFAAEAIGRIKGVPGVALATSGPGATNLVTAIGSCYFDSVPAVFITGQVNTTELSEDTAIRQQGFQETDIVSIVKPITKGAWLVKDATQIPAVFSKAFRLALEGRPGPVLIDLPMNVQRMDIAAKIDGFEEQQPVQDEAISRFVDEAFAALASAERPLLVAGGGIRSSRAAEGFRVMADGLGVPVAQTLMGLDTLPFSHPLRIGMMGSYGNRWVNQAIMQSDCLLVLGARLDVRQTGADVEGFKGVRRIFHVDCIEAQINNRVKGCIPCVAHLADFFEIARGKLSATGSSGRAAWMDAIRCWRDAAPDTEELRGCKGINPNRFLHQLSACSAEAGAVVADVGKNQMWVGQSMELADGQRLLMSGGLGSMGFGLPAAIGANFATGKPVVSINGDGGMQCNLQALEVVSSHCLPLKMVVFNNKSLGMVSQFQDEYFESRMQSTVWGYSAPDFEAVSKAFGIPARTISATGEIPDALEWLWKNPGEPALLVVMVDIDTKISPKVAFGRAIDDMDPKRD